MGRGPAKSAAGQQFVPSLKHLSADAKGKKPRIRPVPRLARLLQGREQYMNGDPMPASHTDDMPQPVTAPYFEHIARRFVSAFGEDALYMIDLTIERMEETGPDFALDIWRDIRLTLLRKAASQGRTLLQ